MDRFLIDFFDGCCRTAQKNGINLLSIHVWSGFGLMLMAYTTAHLQGSGLGWKIFFVVLFGLILLARTYVHKLWGDYPTNEKSMDAVNSIALSHREGFWRWFNLGFITSEIVFVILWFASVIPIFPWGILIWTAFLVDGYLLCAFCVGPGEFGKAKEEREMSDSVPQGFNS